eukprot:Nitzschia sp. Nitz4//scaffold39_size137210//100059//103271//NITZ4_003214-RA/size137210-augustus-gene-0.194-mRNA-1//-1//CDS//3329550428//7856//frame0
MDQPTANGHPLEGEKPATKNMQREKTLQFWDDFHEENKAEEWIAKPTPQLFQLLGSHFPPRQDNLQMLEVGCGTSTFAREFLLYLNESNIDSQDLQESDSFCGSRPVRICSTDVSKVCVDICQHRDEHMDGVQSQSDDSNTQPQTNPVHTTLEYKTLNLLEPPTPESIGTWHVIFDKACMDTFLFRNRQRGENRVYPSVVRTALDNIWSMLTSKSEDSQSPNGRYLLVSPRSKLKAIRDYAGFRSVIRMSLAAHAKGSVKSSNYQKVNEAASSQETSFLYICEKDPSYIPGKTEPFKLRNQRAARDGLIWIPLILHKRSQIMTKRVSEINGPDNNEVELEPLTTTSVLTYDDTETATKESAFEDENIIDHMLYPRESDVDTPWNLDDWLFPPGLPRQCQLLRPENIAIPACYLLVGVLLGLLGPLINVYPLDLGATEAQQTTLSSLRSLPATFKLIFGFISDNYPLLGFRRKSYMLLGWSLAAVSMGSLIFYADLSLSHEEYISDDGDTIKQTIAPKDAPSIPFLGFTTLLFCTGFWIADVMADSVVAEKAKMEPPQSRGSVQSTCYSYRFFGSMVAAPLASYLYSSLGPHYVILLMALLPLSILPLVYILGEVPNMPVASTSDQCNEIWKTVCSRAVWQPLGFVYIYNVLQVANGAWKEYLRTTLGFTANQLNMIYIVGTILVYLGILSYKYFLMHRSWRLVYICTTLLNGLFSVLQVLLIWGLTFGIPDFWFALGDDAFAEFIMGIQFLPTTIMMVHLCPSGSEGASYAMFTTVNNSAINVSAALATGLLQIWDVSKSALANYDLDGMVNLTYLTTALQVSGILFVGLLPKTKEDLFELKDKEHGSSVVGGTVFLSITFLSVLYAIFVGLMNIVRPGWSGES